MLDDNLQKALTEYLSKLERSVELVSYLDESKQSTIITELLDMVVALSPLVTHVKKAGAVPFVPSFTVGGTGYDARVSFAGAPMGHEFSSFVLALLQTGGVAPKVDSDVLQRIKALPEMKFETYYSQSCQNCPDIVQALNTIAIINPNIQHIAIDGSAFSEKIDTLGIKAVPAVYRDGDLWWSGRGSIGELLDKLDGGGILVDREPYDVLIVGGGPAGAAAAVYAARKGVRTGMIADRFGGQLLDTDSIENFVATTKTTGLQLAAQLEHHVASYDVDIIKGRQVAGFVAGGLDSWHSVTLDNGETLKAQTVVVATGASWRTLGVPGEDEYRNKGVTFCPHCDGPLFAGKDVAVIGGGNSGVEAALDLAGITRSVTLLELGFELRADAILRDALERTHNITTVTGAATVGIVGGNDVEAVMYKNLETGVEHRLPVSGVFVQVGLVPNTKWLDGQLECTASGEVIIDAKGATNVPGVFAAGDCTTVPYKQIVVAVGAGSAAALGAFDYLIRHKQSSGQSAIGAR